MRRAMGWWGALGVFLCAIGSAGAEPAAGTASASPASEEACRAACGVIVARCTGVFGPAMGDMRPFCERNVLRRCRAQGVQVCAPVQPEPAD